MHGHFTAIDIDLLQVFCCGGGAKGFNGLHCHM